MGKPVKVNLTIDEDIIREAKEIGLNLSKISENALKQAIFALKSANQSTHTKQTDSTDSSPTSFFELVREVGLEPTKAFATGS